MTAASAWAASGTSPSSSRGAAPRDEEGEVPEAAQGAEQVLRGVGLDASSAPGPRFAAVQRERADDRDAAAVREFEDGVRRDTLQGLVELGLPRDGRAGDQQRAVEEQRRRALALALVVRRGAAAGARALRRGESFREGGMCRGVQRDALALHS